MKYITFAILSAMLFIGCGENEKKEQQSEIPSYNIVENYMTRWLSEDNTDSPAFWSKDSTHLLFATAKGTDVVVVYDALTGWELNRIGGTGKAVGQMERPNGVAVFEDMLFVVERDNARLQVFSIPEFKPLGIFGVGDLQKPYGLNVIGTKNSFTVYVTDNYETADEKVPPDSELGKRVWMYHFTNMNNTLMVSSKSHFGATSGEGVIRVIESIWADVENDMLLIPEEDETIRNIKVYDLKGNFKKVLQNEGVFKSQPEGLLLYKCADGSGFWIMTDQDFEKNYFYVFDRKSLDLIGRFRGENTLNTDGIALTQKSFSGFTRGAFFAVNNDGGVSAMDLGTIMDSLKLKYNCTN